MALIREINSNENVVNYIGTVAFFCVISCTIIMLRFGGFKATFNLLSKGKKNDIDEYEKAPGVPICGAYRISRDEFYTDVRMPDTPKKITPSMVQLPPSQRPLKPSKSVDDVTKPTTGPASVHKSTPNIPQTPQQNLQNKNLVKQQKKLEKQQLAERIKREKAAAKEQQKEEKLRKEREKQAQRSQTQGGRSKTSKSLAKPQKVKQPSTSTSQPLTSNQPPAANPQSQTQSRLSTNTLESSISKSSGPPPYSATAEVVPNKKDDTGNTSFSEPQEDMGSWDMISQHRQQMKRHQAVKDVSKQTHLDLQYNAGISNVAKDINNTDV